MLVLVWLKLIKKMSEKEFITCLLFSDGQALRLLTLEFMYPCWFCNVLYNVHPDIQWQLCVDPPLCDCWHNSLIQVYMHTILIERATDGLYSILLIGNIKNELPIVMQEKKFVWTNLPGLSNAVLWPVEVVEEENEMLEVFCKSDDTM